MCGIYGCASPNDKSFLDIIEGLIRLQHRGQDSFGIANQDKSYKKMGLVKQINHDEVKNINGKYLIGHVRYRTSGEQSVEQIHPINYGRITIVHNGNIINKDVLKCDNYSGDCSDSQLLCEYLSKKLKGFLTNEFVFRIINDLQKKLEGSFSILMIIKDFGFVAIRDKNGIRPLVACKTEDGSFYFASESSALKCHKKTLTFDFKAGESMILRQYAGKFTIENNIYKESCLTPCLFEYLYFASNESVIDSIPIYQARYNIGRLLAKQIVDKDIDFIVPVPESGRTFAYGVSKELGIPIHEAIIKNRYVDRTFIMLDNNKIIKNIRRKLTVVDEIIKDKRILLVDDSIVRGNTSKHIVKILKDSGVSKIYFASASPKIININQYGIYLPRKEELIAYNKRHEELEVEMGCDKVIYNDLTSIFDCLREMSTIPEGFEHSMFTP